MNVWLFEWNHLWRHHFPHLHNTKTWISLKRKKIAKKEKPFFFTVKSLSNRQQLFFYLIGTLNVRIESLPSSELDHLLSNIFLNKRRKKWRRVATISSFQRSIKRQSIEKRYALILKDNEHYHTQGQRVRKIEKRTSCEAQYSMIV